MAKTKGGPSMTLSAPLPTPQTSTASRGLRLAPQPPFPCLQLSESLPLLHGGHLDRPRLAYELSGPAGAPVVLVLGGISSHRHVTATPSDPSPGWWQAMVGPGCAIDTRRFRVLGFDFLGGNGDSTGPRNQPAFDHGIATVDQAQAIVRLLDTLRIDRLAAVVGASYGGMVSLALATLYPQRLGCLVAISAGHKSHPRSTAWRSVQRKIVRLAQRSGAASEGLSLARGLAMTTYRSPTELDQRFGHGAPCPPRRTHDVQDGFRFAIDDYLEARGADFAECFDPTAFLCLSESLDLHRLEPANIRVPTTLVGVRSDPLVPVGHLRELADILGQRGRLVEIESLYGHDAFLKEIETLGPLVRAELDREIL